MWPAVIAAKSLIINEIGFENTPINSIGKMITLIISGIPGVQNMCFQYCLFPEKFVMRKVKIAKVIVTAILPVKLAAAGNNPSTFPKNIKKNRVNIYGKYFS